MNSTVGIVTIASGVVLASAALYAINKGIEYDSIIAKFEENKEHFHALVKNLLEMGKDFLIRLYNTISELIKEAVFRLKIKASYY